jgi:GTPase SAR1 family protein
LRPLSYPNTDIFLICHSLAHPVSYKNIFEKWIPEVQKHCPNTPFIIVGTKSDIRYDQSVLDKLKKRSIRPWTTEEIKNYSEQKIAELGPTAKPACILECSAKTSLDGLKSVFDTTMKVVLKERQKYSKSSKGKRKKRKDECTLL